MPVLYLHGVANRPGAAHDRAVAAIGELALRYVAPRISDDPAGVAFRPVTWGDLGAVLAWDGASRPRSKLLGQGVDDLGTPPPLSDRLLTLAEHLDDLLAVPVAPAGGPKPGGGLISGGARPADGATAASVRLRDLEPDVLADLLAATMTAVTPAGDPRWPSAVMAADDVAHDAGVRARLAGAPSLDAELAVLQQSFDGRLNALLAERGALAGMGAGDWGLRLRDRLAEVAGRGTSAPAWAASRVLLEARGPLNTLAAAFLGDILVYVQRRGTPQTPGPIPLRLLEALRRAAADSAARGGEPVVLLTHSMGGQIAYDVLTTFLPVLRQEAPTEWGSVRVDFWAAAASQVPFFEELKLFLASDPQFGAHSGRKAPVPARDVLGSWWNVFDPNDVLSFTAAAVFDGALDEEYDGGMSLAGAHGAYLARPSFYRRWSERLRDAADRGWDR